MFLGEGSALGLRASRRSVAAPRLALFGNATPRLTPWANSMSLLRSWGMAANRKRRLW
jgi:hypothetical protein